MTLTNLFSPFLQVINEIMESMREMVKYIHAQKASAVELLLHIFLNILTFCALKSREDIVLTHNALHRTYLYTIISGIMCCSVLSSGIRLSSSIGFSVLAQLSFLVLALVDCDEASINATSRGLFTTLLSLHVSARSDVDNYLLSEFAVASVIFRMMCAPPHSLCAFEIVTMLLLLIFTHATIWRKEYYQYNFLHFKIVGHVSILALAMAILWKIMSWDEWLDLQTLSCVGFALFAGHCHLGLSSAEMLLTCSFVYIAVGFLTHLWSCSGVSTFPSSTLSVLSVSTVGVTGTFVLGMVKICV